MVSHICPSLQADGFVIVEDFIPASLVTQLRDEATHLRSTGGFKRAGVGKLASTHDDIRRDEVHWWGPPYTPTQEKLLLALDDLKASLNRAYLGLVDWEGHYSCYPPGAFYQKHVDRFQKDDRRTVSTVLYLNEVYSEENGGELVLHLNDGIKRITPRGGRLVLFMSDEIPHEVVTTRAPRWSIAGWYRRN